VFERLKGRLTALKGNPGDNKSLLILALVAVLATGGIVTWMWLGGQDYTALFGSQEKIPVAKALEVLDAEKISYRINPSDGRILVPSSDVSRARMTLSAKGVQSIQPAGYELMDKDELLGSSQFVQNVRYKRSLEGELEQTIMSLDGVEAARVQLAINESSSFVVNAGPENSASIMVKLRPGTQLAADQINAIVHLVATSVPSLKPERVSLVDQAGNLLSDNVSAAGSTGGKKRNSMLATLQDQTHQALANVLTPLVGEKNYRISIMPELDMSDIEETRENYLGDPKVTNEHVQSDNTLDSIASGIPGSLSNRPPAAAAANAPAVPAENKDQNTRNSHLDSMKVYHYNTVISHVKYPGFEVKRLSVAVVLNQSAVKEWKDDQKAQLQEVLKNAAGINVQRGDVLSLSMMQFIAPAKVVPPLPLKWWQNPDLMSWVELIGSGLLALLALLLVGRPLGKRLAAANSKPAPVAVADDSLDQQVLQVDENGVSEERKGLDLPSFPGEDNLPAMSSGLETKIEFLQKLAISDTDRVVDVFKQWIGSNERNQPK